MIVKLFLMLSICSVPSLFLRRRPSALARQHFHMPVLDAHSLVRHTCSTSHHGQHTEVMPVAAIPLENSLETLKPQTEQGDRTPCMRSWKGGGEAPYVLLEYTEDK